MKKTSCIMMLALSSSVYAGGYFDFGVGAMHRMLDGDKLSYESNQSVLTEFGIGYAGKKWDIALDGSYSFGRQKEMELNYTDSVRIKDDFNMHSFNIGPTLKYHVETDSGKWHVVPFIGAFYNYTVFENTAELRDSITNETEDKEHGTWGYGGKLGVEFKQLTPGSSWSDSINYKVFASYTKYREIEGDYQSGNRIVEFKSDTPDNLYDYSVGFSIGFSIGDKLGKKVVSSAKKLVNL